MTSVLARCVQCAAERRIEAHEIPPGDHPMCHRCYMPMVPVLALSDPKRAAMHKAERAKKPPDND